MSAAPKSEISFSTGNEPHKPLIAIEAGRGWAGLDLRDLWLHRDLFFFLIWRDVKVRYKQTVLGAAGRLSNRS